MLLPAPDQRTPDPAFRVRASHLLEQVCSKPVWSMQTSSATQHGEQQPRLDFVRNSPLDFQAQAAVGTRSARVPVLDSLPQLCTGGNA